MQKRNKIKCYYDIKKNTTQAEEKRVSHKLALFLHYLDSLYIHKLRYILYALIIFSHILELVVDSYLGFLYAFIVFL